MFHIHYYSSLLNIELLLSHCEKNGFLPPPVSVSMTLFNQIIVWNPTWFSVGRLESGVRKWDIVEQKKKKREEKGSIKSLSEKEYF